MKEEDGLETRLSEDQIQEQLSNTNSFYNRLIYNVIGEFDNLSYEFKNLQKSLGNDVINQESKKCLENTS